MLRFVNFMALFAKKSLGQHFLNSKHVLGQIITASNIAKGENVLEIGPGTGALTRPLLDAGAKVIAAEKDDRAIDFLKGIFTTECESGQLTVVHGDILELRKAQSASNGTGGDTKPIISLPYAVIANIPYYITGSILQSFLEFTPRPTRMVLLVQKEVAERIVARDSKESILAISVKAFCNAKIIANVPRGAFTPPPNVESAILSLENITDERFVQNNVEISRFFRILKAGFAHKRKYLKRNIEEVLSADEILKLSAKWTELNLDEKVRAEDLELDTWFKLAK